MKVLLHACCAVCAAAVIKKLQSKGHQLIVFFYNPNIFPEEEYQRRKQELERFFRKNQIIFLEGNYNHQDWLDKVKAYSHSPEGGQRCQICFCLRLSEAAQVAREQRCQALATTLTISPHKNPENINKIGKEMAEIYGLEFLAQVWRKQGGYEQACQIAKQERFYRQNYCGCEFSQR